MCVFFLYFCKVNEEKEEEDEDEAVGEKNANWNSMAQMLIRIGNV